MAANGKNIGDIVEVYCTRCRLNLDASVAAVDGDTILKVMCRTCGNEGKYRPPVDEKLKKKKAINRLMKRMGGPAAPAAPSAPENTGAAPLRQLWDELTDRVDARYAPVYDETHNYEVEDAILHKKYGMGIIHDIHADGTLKVLFRDGFVELPSGGEATLD
jgi:hypothetical protein